MDGGLLQGSGLQRDETPSWGLTDERNWVHEALQPRNPKWGLRIDRVNFDCSPQTRIGVRCPERAHGLSPTGVRV